MKYLVLILAVLVAIPTLTLAGGDDEVLLTDKSSKGLFSFAVIASEPVGKNSATAKGGYFTTKFRQGYIVMWYQAKRTKNILDLGQYSSVSLDVRVRDNASTDVSSVLINFWKADGKTMWEAKIPRTTIPHDGKQYRLVIPVSNFVPMGNPPPNDKTGLFKLAFGIGSEVEHETLSTDLGNVILWKKPVDEVTVIPLEK